MPFCDFPYIKNVNILNITRAIKKVSVNEIRDFIFKNHYKTIGFSKENGCYSMKSLKKKDLPLLGNKLTHKIPDPRNAKKHYQSFIRKKNIRSVKQSEIITYQPKTFENPNIVDIKSIITVHPKTSHKISKTVRQTEKVVSIISLYSDTKKLKFFSPKNV